MSCQITGLRIWWGVGIGTGMRRKTRKKSGSSRHHRQFREWYLRRSAWLSISEPLSPSRRVPHTSAKSLCFRPQHQNAAGLPPLSLPYEFWVLLQQFLSQLLVSTFSNTSDRNASQFTYTRSEIPYSEWSRNATHTLGFSKQKWGENVCMNALEAGWKRGQICWEKGDRTLLGRFHETGWMNHISVWLWPVLPLCVFPRVKRDKW